MPQTSLPVEHLFTFTGNIGRGTSITSGPMGTRVIVPVLSAEFNGPKLRGKLADAPSGDWVYARPDGSIKLDVRVTLLTDDGAADERYRWLNNIQAVGIGSFGRGNVIHDVYALR